MACPFFFPTVKADVPQTLRAPLGSLFDGECRAMEGANAPHKEMLYRTCNFGYARGQCPSFPIASDSDAIRFTRLGKAFFFVYERDHFPVRHGELLPDADALLRRQAQAFTESTPS